jgi:hypothetical protein
MKPARPKHCSGCVRFHSAGRPDPKGGMEKFNAWCAHFGKAAEKAVGMCKAQGAKRGAA